MPCFVCLFSLLASVGLVKTQELVPRSMRKISTCAFVRKDTQGNTHTDAHKIKILWYVMLKKKCIPYLLRWAPLVTCGRGKFPLARLSQSQRARQKLWNVQFWLLFFQLQALQTTIDFGLRRCWRIIFLFQITFRIPIRLMYLPLGSQWLIIVINYWSFVIHLL